MDEYSKPGRLKPPVKLVQIFEELEKTAVELEKKDPIQWAIEIMKIKK